MGPFCFLCFPALFVFCCGLRPVLGRVFPPGAPQKSASRPSLRGVCVRSGRIPLFLFVQGARAALKAPAPMKTPFFAGEIQRDAVGRTCNCDVCECPFGPLPEPPLLLCAPVKVATGKPSVLRAETYRTRDLSVVLETHQLYSRLISCTRMISTLPWELKCVCVCVCVRVRAQWRSVRCEGLVW